MKEDLDYGHCKECGLRFYTYSYAWLIMDEQKCPKCGTPVYVDNFTADFWRAIDASYINQVYIFWGSGKWK